MPVATFLGATAKVPRVPGLAVYLTRSPEGVPTALTARVPDAQRIVLEDIAPGLARGRVVFGFMERTDRPADLALLPDAWREDPMRKSYLASRQALVPTARPAMARWRLALFGGLLRLAGRSLPAAARPARRAGDRGRVEGVSVRR